jgi:hypothetical protein
MVGSWTKHIHTLLALPLVLEREKKDVRSFSYNTSPKKIYFDSLGIDSTEVSVDFSV